MKGPHENFLRTSMEPHITFHWAAGWTYTWFKPWILALVFPIFVPLHKSDGWMQGPSLLENFWRDKGQSLCDKYNVLFCISMTSPYSLNRSTIFFKLEK